MTSVRGDGILYMYKQAGSAAASPRNFREKDQSGRKARPFPVPAPGRKERKAMDKDFEKLREIIIDVAGVAEDEIKEDTRFVDDLQLDSLDLAQIIMGIEQEYDVTVDPEVAQKVVTVGDALELIKKAGK